MAIETWVAKKLAATTPAAKATPPPRALQVEGKPELLVLSASGGKRVVRIQGSDDAEPGSP